MNTLDPKTLHQQFISLGRERNKITYKLLVLLPQIYQQNIYKTHGYATIYEYAGKLAGLSHSVVEKALKLEEKMFADKVKNMSKQALQQFSREFRGKIQTSWNIEMDTEMMTSFLKLKEKVGKNLSNKEALRRMLEMLEGKSQLSGVELTHALMDSREGEEEGIGHSAGASCLMVKNERPQPQAKTRQEIPGERENEHRSFSPNPPPNHQDSTMDFQHQRENKQNWRSAPSRYIPIAQKREVLAKTNGICSHENCCNPAQIFHHQIRFSQAKNHTSIIPLCKIHHEFAHNGITEPLTQADELYRKYRQETLI